MGKFSDAVREFVVISGKNADVVLRNSVDELYKEVIRTKMHGGNLPHDTGNLGRSVAISKHAMPRVDTETLEYDTQDYSPVVFSVDAGDTVYIGVQAAYGPRMEYGFVGTDSKGRTYNQSGNHFVEKAADKWPQIVKAQEARFAK